MADAQAPQSTSKKKHRRWPWVIGGIFGFSFLLIGAVLFLLSSAVDRAVLVRGILDVVNGQFAGRIMVQKAWLFPDGHFIAHDVTIRGPDGEIIIQAKSVETHVDLPALPKKRLHLTGTTVDGASVFLATDSDGGVNIADAFSPKHPKPTEPPKPAEPSTNGFVVDIPGANVNVDEARFVTDGNVTAPVAELRHVAIQASFLLDPTAAITVTVPKLQADALAPVSGALRLTETSLHIAGPELTAATDVTLDDTHLKAQTDLNLVTLSGKGSVTDAVIGQKFLATYLKDLDPRGAKLDAAVALKTGRLELESLHVTPLSGSGQVNVAGSLNLTKGDAKAQVDVKALDARAFFGKLPETRLTLGVDAVGKGVFGDARSVSAKLRVGTSSIQKQSVGPGVAQATFAGGTLGLNDIDLAFPGGRVRGKGKVSGKTIAATAQIDAPNLGALRAALEGMLDLNFPDFSGNLQSTVEISGPLMAPAVQAQVDAPHLELNGLSADGLSANLNAARLASAMDLQGTVTVAAFHFADRTLHDIAISVAWTTPDLHLEVQAKEESRTLNVTTDLLLPKDLQSATLSTLRLNAGGNDWTLAQPAKLDFHNGVVIDNLELRSDPQQLAVSLTVAPHVLTGAARIESFDLSRLPAALFPSLHLAGIVEGQAHYQEKDGKRGGSADLTLQQIAYQGLTVPSAQVHASLDGQQVAAKVSASLGHGTVTLQASGPIPEGVGAIAGEVQAQGIVLDDFDGVVPALAGIHAALSLNLQLAGSWAAPRVALKVAAADVTGSWTTDRQAGALGVPLTVDLDLDLDPQGLKQSFEVRAAQTELISLVGSAPLASRRFFDSLTAPKKLVADLLALPLDEKLTLTELPLQPVMHLVSANTRLQGTLSANGTIRGVVRAPRGALKLSGEQLELEGRPLGTLGVQLSATDKGFEGHVDLKPPAGDLKIDSSWQIAPEALGNAKARLAARLTADVKLAALPLAVALGSDAALQGLTDVTASFRGSLAIPDAKVQVSLHDLALQQVPVGKLDLQATWNGTHLIAKVDGSQPQGGLLAAHADLPVNLQGAPKTQPMTASLDASGFDLAPFGTIAATGGMLRDIAGRLDAHLQLGGTLSAPAPSGRLGLAAGKLALAGFGQFSDLVAQLSLDRDGLEIEEISAKSAGGPLEIKGSVRRDPAKGFAVQTHIDSKRFGVYISDRLLGFLTSNEDLTGSVDTKRTDLVLAIHDLVFNLPQLVPKTAGATAIDSDIVMGKRSPPPPKDPNAYAIQLQVVAPSGLQVKATDLDIQARADLTLLVQGDALIKGGVYTTGGDVNAYGRRFRIDHANITFGHGDVFGPAGLPDIDARATQNIGKYKLFVDVSGNPSDIKIVPSSDPPLDKEQVGLLLVTGSADGVDTTAAGGTSQGGSLVAASALGGVVTEKLRESMGAYMPLDVLTFEPNHLEAGKHITRRLYVGVIENPGATDPRVNGAEVHANYKLTQHWSLDSRYGTSQAGDFDVQWTRSW